jgi:hypothetical protein
MPIGIIIKKWLGDLIQVRNEQIEYYNNQINKLTEFDKRCPQTIIDFLIMNNKLNQYRTKNIINSDPIYLKDTLQNNLEQIENDINSLDKVLSLEDDKVCEELKKIMMYNKMRYHF